jgi:hypothetical protein
MPYDDREEELEPLDHYELIDRVGFADPGGGSALRAATKENPRDLPCPTCGKPDKLTYIDQMFLDGQLGLRGTNATHVQTD